MKEMAAITLTEQEVDWLNRYVAEGDDFEFDSNLDESILHKLWGSLPATAGKNVQ